MPRHMLRAWAWRQVTCCPVHRLVSKNKLHTRAASKDVIPRYPRLVPWRPVDLQALNVESAVSIAACRRDFKCLVVFEIDAHGREPWSKNQECCLPSHWIQADHLPLSQTSVFKHIKDAHQNLQEDCSPWRRRPSFLATHLAQSCTDR